ncbi:SusD/RagB family nutrient-binding outer membrane lipoprotein [Daejeonella oryzae]|uniref:SusD/RagB family nutrient-binding outer membrane lipoprotein n=1 Tax=Daejeonella oryzae TaxID=1122943 RepID=UPI0004095772|nr:SusD/RagB family nutrient-binding outer membrane lipoprotein [Daejeonella oryzae]
MKKIHIYILSIVALAGMISISSCTKELGELNIDPNNSTNATPDQLIGPAVYETLAINLNRSHRLNGDLMQDHVTRIDGDEVHRYVIRPNESDYLWNNWYLKLTNFKDIYNSGEATGSKTYMAIGLICQAWVYSLLTDTFGDIPYSEANRGREGLLTPKFDAQKDIYTDIFAKLDSANNLLKTPTTTLTLDQIKNDVLFGNATSATAYASSWRKFGNSLYLRLLMRVSAKNELVANGMTPADKIRDIAQTNSANYPIFTNNSESAIVKFTGVSPLFSPFYLWRDYDWNGSISLGQFFVNNLKEWGDPRIERWATKSQNVYEGIPSGYEQTKVPEARSTYPVALKTEALLGNIMNYPELQFILAEAALKGYISGSPKTYYDSGVINGITLWGYAVPADYLINPELAWNDSELEDVKMEKIMTQKYYDMFFTDFQQWFEYRRTGKPTLPKGEGLRNNGEMPSRLYYPIFLQSLNGANYNAAVAAMGSDDLNTKMWWQKN